MNNTQEESVKIRGLTFCGVRKWSRVEDRRSKTFGDGTFGLWWGRCGVTVGANLPASLSATPDKLVFDRLSRSCHKALRFLT